VSQAVAATREHLLHDYLGGEGPYGLHLGAGTHLKPGWLNCDSSHHHQQNLYIMDVTKPFPLPNEAFHYVFSEHTIEHFDFDLGQVMLKEAWRVLKPGGIIRIATPSVGFLMNLYSHDRTQLEDEYIAWHCKSFQKDKPKALPGFVLNYFVRAWTHTFIYDRETLPLALSLAGFEHIVERSFLSSEHAMLRNAENAFRMPKGYLKVETMIFEGQKPGSPAAAAPAAPPQRQ
jgi:predicted SAM-dependent methyltransferase